MQVINCDSLEGKKFGIKVKQVVAVFHIEMEGGPEDLRIEVLTHGVHEFLGVCNYAFWAPGMKAPYKSLFPQTTIEAAVNDALKGITANLQPNKDLSKIFWHRVPWPMALNSQDYLSGQGERVTFEEARRMTENG